MESGPMIWILHYNLLTGFCVTFSLFLNKKGGGNNCLATNSSFQSLSNAKASWIQKFLYCASKTALTQTRKPELGLESLPGISKRPERPCC